MAKLIRFYLVLCPKGGKMPGNILRAILNIASFKENSLKSYASTYLNRVNAVGEQLEFYIKDAIATSLKLPYEKKQEAYSGVFSWLGNQNHPPDIIIKNGDAFEIKKIEGLKSALALNSSPPKNKLRSDDIRITEDCRKCDGGSWKEKDLFYVVGNAKGGVIKYLFFVQGTCYAAEHLVYEKEKAKFKKIYNKESFSFNPRYGRIKNLLAYFKEFLKYNPNKFNVFTVIENKKYLSFPGIDRKHLENSNDI